MINPVELFVGLRYLRAKRRTRFVSFITLISLIGIALGVAALIVILSVMNGFEGELRSRLLSMSAHGFVTGPKGVTSDWRQLVEEVEAEEGVAAAAPIVELEGMIQYGRDLRAVIVHGVDPEYEERLSGDVINHLHVHMLVRSEHRNTGPAAPMAAEPDPKPLFAPCAKLFHIRHRLTSSCLPCGESLRPHI